MQAVTDVSPEVPSTRLSLLRGADHPPLLDLTLGQLCDQQAEKYDSKTAIVVAWSQARLTYHDLRQRSKELAKSLLALGVRRGDRVAIFSGDDERYIELFFATARIGAILVMFNKLYTVEESVRAIKHSEPMVFFLADQVNHKSTEPLIQQLREDRLGIKHVVRTRWTENMTGPEDTWATVLNAGCSLTMRSLEEAEALVRKDDIVNIQFTSGTTGAPKAAMLTHFGLVNNGRFIGDYLGTTDKDVLCCPPPLFHCFGLVAGLLAAFTHGTTIVLAKRDFDAAAVVDLLVQERCTILHGVPTMFTAIMQHMNKMHIAIDTIRTGIAAGTNIPPALVDMLHKKLGFRSVCITYGMTETSPASFMTKPTDTMEQKMETVGSIFPHVTAKVIDSEGRIVPLGVRGELCVSGWLLQQGYYKNPQKTAEVMIRDKDGTLWMHTGDEATIDGEGYCRITGRIKDMIIRGGENIYPLEVEERLLQHSAINDVSIVGLKDEKYGEIVAGFSSLQPGHNKPSLDELRNWVQQRLARHKAPTYCFWVGPSEAIKEFPLTGNGKIRKETLRDIGHRILKAAKRPTSAKL